MTNQGPTMGQDIQQDFKGPCNMDSLKQCPSTRAAPGGSEHQRGRKGAPLVPPSACLHCQPLLAAQQGAAEPSDCSASLLLSLWTLT